MQTNSPKKSLILIVIQHASTRVTAVNVLNHAGFQTLDTEDGRQGISLFIEKQPDVVIVDTPISTQDDYKLIQAINQFDKNRSVPILILTEPEDIKTMEYAFKAGATDFTIHSNHLKHLAQRIKYILRSAKTEQQLRNALAQLEHTQKLAKIGYWEWNAEEDNVSGSNLTFDLLGIPKQKGLSFEQFISHVLPKDTPLIHQAISDANQGLSYIAINFRVTQLDGNTRHIECLGNSTFSQSGKLQKISGSIQDITRLHKDESLIEYQNRHDALTGLPNRAHFSQTLEEFLADRNINALSAVIIFDIDRFKQININLSQEQGDHLLRNLAQRVSRVIREADFAARLGSDEFAILVKNVQDLSELNLLMGRIVHDLSKPFLLNYQEIFISYSFGVSVFPNDAKDVESLLNHANISRSIAKTQGGNQFVFYHSGMNAKAQGLLSLENDLRRALANNQIEVFYQPQVHAKSLLPTGAEALVRWNHPKHGIISPTVFIPLAESTGLIIDIGRYVLQCAIFEAQKWHDLGFNTMRIGINLSSRQFTQSNLMKDVQEILSQTTLPPQFIDLELTESLAMNDAENSLDILKGLKALGVSLAIDDFGTGYSSLSYLQSFPIDTIKVDQSFVQNLTTQEGQSITRTILAMAESLNLEVIAEGIESQEQAEFFKDKHCTIFQGFKYGKPMPSAKFLSWLTKHSI
ncbi:diguanylate cyclase/phosphodiesterase (GGDEF & EAL domains) with PAS/PAC sensor(s) [hydrothermal vent metagenome]|uniref:Diguanylate cyclase/phosphodiesterase (GGDEF & EAL domains) with PAS/PAC sensor(S) n=1 Tax=hydrothermal vent metagenome TaxID=652676 RepID=A0A3B0VQN4_9ZZZZ